MADNNIWSFQKEINKLERNSLNLKVGLVWLKFMGVLIAREFIVSLNDHRGAITPLCQCLIWNYLSISLTFLARNQFRLKALSKKFDRGLSIPLERYQDYHFIVFSVTYVQGRQPIFHGIDAKGCTYSSIHKMIRY